MSLLELEDKIEKFLNCDATQYDNLQNFYSDVITYIRDNETIFLNLDDDPDRHQNTSFHDDTVSVRTKIIIVHALNTECNQTFLDCFLESNVTWTFFLRFIMIYSLHFENKELLIESYRQEKLDGVNEIDAYQKLLFVFFKTNDSFDRLSDAFIDHFQNINDETDEFFWILLTHKDINLLKKYDNKYQLKITDRNTYMTYIYKNWLPLDIIKVAIISFTVGFNINTYDPYVKPIDDNSETPGGTTPIEKLLIETAERLKNKVTESKMYYQSSEITDENILETFWQVINDKHEFSPLIAIANHFDHMTMSECVCWYARITSKCNNEELFTITCQTTSTMFLEYAIDVVNTYDIESLLTNENCLNFNFNEVLVKVLIKLKPDMLDSLICYALRSGNRILNMLIPNITCQDVIKYIEEHPKLLEKQVQSMLNRELF